MHSKALVQKLGYVNPGSQNNKNDKWPFLVALQSIYKQGVLLNVMTHYHPGSLRSRRVGMRDIMVLEHVLSNEGSLLIVVTYISLHTATVTRELSVFQDL